MKIHVVLFSLILVLLAFVSCSEETIIGDRSTEIEVGNSSDVVVRNTNIVMTCDLNSEEVLKLDLNGNGNDDIRFNMKFGRGAGFTITTLKATPMADQFEFLGELQVDTVFKRIETSLDSNEDFRVIYSIDNIRSCVRKDSTDMIDEVLSRFQPSFLEKGETFGVDNNFESHILQLNPDGAYSSIQGSTGVGDSLCLRYSTYRGNCHNRLEYGKVQYICFRLATHDRLGWIKLMLAGPTELQIQAIGLQE